MSLSAGLDPSRVTVTARQDSISVKSSLCLLRMDNGSSSMNPGACACAIRDQLSLAGAQP